MNIEFAKRLNGREKKKSNNSVRDDGTKVNPFLLLVSVVLFLAIHNVTIVNSDVITENVNCFDSRVHRNFTNEETLNKSEVLFLGQSFEKSEKNDGCTSMVAAFVPLDGTYISTMGGEFVNTFFVDPRPASGCDECNGFSSLTIRTKDVRFLPFPEEGCCNSGGLRTVCQDFVAVQMDLEGELSFSVPFSGNCVATGENNIENTSQIPIAVFEGNYECSGDVGWVAEVKCRESRFTGTSKQGGVSGILSCNLIESPDNSGTLPPSLGVSISGFCSKFFDFCNSSIDGTGCNITAHITSSPEKTNPPFFDFSSFPQVGDSCGSGAEFDRVGFAAALCWGLRDDQGSVFLERNTTGQIIAQLKSTDDVLTFNDFEGIEEDIQKATIRLLKQSNFVRDRKEDESVSEYLEFLKNQGQEEVAVPCECDLIGKDGIHTFDDLPLFESVTINGNKVFRPVYYTVEVTNATSDEVTDVDKEETKTLYFTSNVITNLRPDREAPFRTHKISLTPFFEITMKERVANDLLRVGPEESGNINYKDEEQAVLSWLDDLKTKEV